MNMTSHESSASSSSASTGVTVETLLRQKRRETPSAAFWSQKFEPRFTRKLMGEVARPRHQGRALKIVGWGSPLVFAALVGVALTVAYFFSPVRAIARWESQTVGREYVVDQIHPTASSRSYAVDHSMGEYSFTSSVADGVSNTLPSTASHSQF